MPSNGVTISVTAETNAGGRKHMEDYIAVNLCPNDTLKAIPDMREQAFVGVFDGHGGKEAAKFARENLWEFIQTQSKFLTHNVESVKEAIREAYLDLHQKMLDHRASWQPNKTGDLSTAGTTACTIIFRKNHIFVANVGDSTAVMGIRNPHFGQPGEPPVIAQVISRDHKPEDPSEQEHIRKLGGQVAMSAKGVMRVVWERSRCKSNGTTEVDFIPFLSVARSLGDYWSYNPRSEKYTVSPDPDVSVIPLDLSTQKFVVVASDGLWNVMSPNDVVTFIDEYQDELDEYHQPKDVVSALIKEALFRWSRKGLQADNIAILIAFLSEEESDPCGPSGIQSSSAPVETSAQPSTVSSTSPRSTSPDSTAVAVVGTPDTSLETLDHSSHPATTPIVPDVSSSTSTSSVSSSSSPSKPALVRRVTQSRSGSTEFYSEVWPDGVTIEYETKIKLRRRKHKKHKKHSLEKELARRGLHRLRNSTSITHNAVVLRPSVPSKMETEDVPSSIPNLHVDQEFSMLGSVNGLKRKHDLEEVQDEEEEDEGVLIPPSQKRNKPINNDSLSVVNTLSLRSQRLSTDTGSDSGSSTSSSTSGIGSDMDCTSPDEGLSEPALDTMLADEQQVKDKEDEFALYCCTHPTESIHSTERVREDIFVNLF